MKAMLPTYSMMQPHHQMVSQAHGFISGNHHRHAITLRAEPCKAGEDASELMLPCTVPKLESLHRMDAPYLDEF